ncbi:AraC family transcriptional regulator [Puniceicoccaceae bacterium K14]|nr:AraC family transcriptional regulator [Puniceicoccaceae bacterium K14]
MNLIHEQVSIGQALYPPKGVFGPKQLKEYQLFVLVSGNSILNTEGSDHSVAPGEVRLLMPGMQLLRFDEDRSSQQIWCSVSPDALTPAQRKRLEAAPRQAKATTRLLTLLELAISLPYGAGKDSPDLLLSLATSAILEYLHSCAPIQNDKISEPNPLRLALEYIEQHYQSKIDLSTLAKASGASIAHITRMFTSHLETPPMRYVWSYRARRGALLLQETGLSVSEIAHITGFQTPFHFSRWIKKTHNLSPRALRQSNWRPSQPLTG